jgi:hypothetical protein
MTYYVLLVDAYIDRRPRPTRGRLRRGLRTPDGTYIRFPTPISRIDPRPNAEGAAPRAHTNTNGHVILCNYIKIPRGVPVPAGRAARIHAVRVLALTMRCTRAVVLDDPASRAAGGTMRGESFRSAL